MKDVTGNFESESGIFPARSLPETSNSISELEGVEFRVPVNELNSRRRVSTCGNLVNSISGISPEK